MSQELVIPQLEERDRDGVLRELVTRMAEVRTLDVDQAHRVLIERERVGSTGIGYGLAIPHARLEPLDRTVACFGRSRQGIDFKARDGEPTYLFLAILAPTGRHSFHLTALARASLLFRGEAFRQQLLEAEGIDELWQAISARDAQLESD